MCLTEIKKSTTHFVGKAEGNRYSLFMVVWDTNWYNLLGGNLVISKEPNIHLGIGPEIPFLTISISKYILLQIQKYMCMKIFLAISFAINYKIL